MILRRHIQKTAKKLEVVKKIGWHTFRRTYASLLTVNKEDLKVVQELMRHAVPTMALGLYAQAFSENAPAAQSKIVEMARDAPMPEDFARSRSVKAGAPQSIGDIRLFGSARRDTAIPVRCRWNPVCHGSLVQFPGRNGLVVPPPSATPSGRQTTEC